MAAAALFAAAALSVPLNDVEPPRNDEHALSAASLMPDLAASCHTSPNPLPFDFMDPAFCTGDTDEATLAADPDMRISLQSTPSKGCWPALYILGVQKGATTSMVDALWQCGATALGMPDGSAGTNIVGCHGTNVPCKEVLHTPIDLRTDAGRNAFTSLYDPSRCAEIADFQQAKDVLLPKTLTERACHERKFLEATPLELGDSPPLAVLLDAMPPPVAERARFVLILREPTSRLLSWYNHMKVTNNFFGQEKRCDVSTFNSYYKCSETEGHHRSSEGGNYVKWFERFHLSRGDATVAMPPWRGDAPRRSQLLVLPFDMVAKDSRQTMKLVTTTREATRAKPTIRCAPSVHR